MPGYDNFQLIAYRVPTFPALLPGDLVDIPQNIPSLAKEDMPASPASLSGDLYKRLWRLIAVIEQAVVVNQISPEADTLKIFMVPEFYFRPLVGGPELPSENEGEPAVSQRCYTEEEMFWVLNVLRRYVSAKRFKDWFFILGTIVWELPNQYLLQGLDDDLAIGNTSVIKNTLLIGSGGLGLGQLDKVRYSNFDAIDKLFMPEISPGQQEKTNLDKTAMDSSAIKSGMTFGQKGKVISTLKGKIGAYLANNNQLSRRQGIIPIQGGRNLGVEVCADHLAGFLTEGLAEYRAAMHKPDFQLDLQLLTACGMWVQPPRVHVAPGHFILRVDGSYTCDIADPPRSEIKRVVGADNNNIPLVTSHAGNDATWRQDNTILRRLALGGKLAFPVPDTKYPLLENEVLITPNAEQTLSALYPQELVVYDTRPVAVQG